MKICVFINNIKREKINSSSGRLTGRFIYYKNTLFKTIL